METPATATTSSSSNYVPSCTAPTVPYRIPWVGHALDFGRDPDGFMARCRQQHGSAFKLLLLGDSRTFLSDPFDYPAYFQSKELIFRNPAEQVGARVFGYATNTHGPEMIEELVHAVQVNLKGEELTAITERMNRIFLERLSSAVGKNWQSDSLFRFLNDHVFVAGVESLFGDGFYSSELRHAYALLDRHFQLLALGVPAAALPGVRAAQDGLARSLLSERTGCSEMMKARAALTDRLGLPAIAAAKVNAPLIWASQSNTVATAFWTVLLILRDPHARAQILDELHHVVGPSSHAGVLTTEMLRKLVKLDSAINETTRLASMALSLREAKSDIELPLASGMRLRLQKGEQLYTYLRMTHMDPDIYEDPHVFKFDRFLATNGPKHFFKNGQRLTFCLLPFGAGESMCPGRFFARNEFKIVVATLLSAFDIELQSAEVPGPHLSRVGIGVPPPVKDVPFRIRRKSGPAAVVLA